MGFHQQSCNVNGQNWGDDRMIRMVSPMPRLSLGRPPTVFEFLYPKKLRKRRLTRENVSFRTYVEMRDFHFHDVSGPSGF